MMDLAGRVGWQKISAVLVIANVVLLAAILFALRASSTEITTGTWSPTPIPAVPTPTPTATPLPTATPAPTACAGIIAEYEAGRVVVSGVGDPEATEGFMRRLKAVVDDVTSTVRTEECDDTEVSIRVSEGIQFEHDSAEIRPEFDEVIRTVAALIGGTRIDVTVEGHTDSSGSDEYNQRLSTERAAATVERLEELGVPPEQLEAVGFGPSQPIASNDSDAGKAKNRRIEFRLGEPK